MNAFRLAPWYNVFLGSVVLLLLSLLIGHRVQAQTEDLTPATAQLVTTGPLSAIQAITAGQYHTCALTNGGGVKCWGDNAFGQLGDGTMTDRLTLVDVSGLTSGVQMIAAGSSHTCALTTGGGIKCWGYNLRGQLCDGTTINRSTPVDVNGLTSGVQSVTAGRDHTCALTTGGGVRCWGYNLRGQLGDGTMTDRSTPVDVSGLTSGVQMVAAGYVHTCALTTGGGVKCWGENSFAQLGDGTTTIRSTPVDVSGLTSGAQMVAAGSDHTCALTTGGGVKCWGENSVGQLGDGTTTDRLTPVDVSGLTNGMQAITAGDGHNCALTTGGGVKCWGYNMQAQLGDGTMISRLTPVDVSGLQGGVQMIDAGRLHTCALTSGGRVKCWGDNSNGQLGDGTTTARLTPVDVSGLTSGVQMVSAGGSHTCALTTAGGLKCWGANHEGQLGDGTLTDRLTPVDVSGLTINVQMVSAGYEHTCALTTGGGTKCWGDNLFAQLGDGTVNSHLTAVDVSGLTSGVQMVTAGLEHTCALTTGGGVKCWGSDSFGQLGNGTGGGSGTPVDVSGLTSGAQMVATGDSHTCALNTAGGVKCWGANSQGQLGDGTTNHRETPVDVNGLTSGGQLVIGGGNHTCALTTAGGLKCWGYNVYGQLGVNPGWTPVDVLDPNAPPDEAAQITSTPVTAATVGQPYTYDVTATGVPTPTFSLVIAPAGMTIDPASGLIQWTPTAAGDQPVTVRAENGVQPPAEQSFTITVSPAPQAAQITSSPSLRRRSASRTPTLSPPPACPRRPSAW